MSSSPVSSVFLGNLLSQLLQDSFILGPILQGHEVASKISQPKRERIKWQKLWQQMFQDLQLRCYHDSTENSKHGMLKTYEKNTKLWFFYTFFWEGKEILLKIGVKSLLFQNREQNIEHR